MTPRALTRRAAVVIILSAALARGEEPPKPRAAPGSWGYWVVASSVVVGGGVTTYGLTLDCAKGDDACRWSTSLAIWGGLGGAMVGSLVGLAIVHDGKRSVRVGATATGSGLPAVVATGEF